MSLNWNWKDKIGEMKIRDWKDENNSFTVNIYKCNGLAVFLYEFNDDGVEKYTMWGFFADKEHMKNCLGLNKGTENIYSREILELRMSKCKEQETMFQAFSIAQFEQDISLIIQKCPF